MEYLDHVLGIETMYLPETIKTLPNFIYARYDLKKVVLNETPAIFVYPKDEMDPVGSVKKHLARITQAEGAPAILVLNSLTSRQKEYLLRDRIPFIVDGKQIYLPFMAVYLQERGDGQKTETATILPSAQLLLLYYIYHGCGEMMTSKACEGLNFTSTSISRASRQLDELGLIRLEKRGVQKVILTEKSPEELFTAAKECLISPVKRTIYVPKALIREELLISGYSALSEFSLLNPPQVHTRATGSISAWEKWASPKLENTEDQYAVELWRYDPKKLTKDECVDRLSLALSLDANGDERVEEAMEEMLEQVWRDINGQRY